jgi:hypothetical protein
VDAYVGRDGQFIEGLKKLSSVVFVLLDKRDISETIDNLYLVGGFS